MNQLVSILTCLALCTSAHADTQPQAPDLLGVSCGGNLNRVVIVLSTNPADGSRVGREWETTRCALSGRGGRSRLYTACATLQWDAAGNVIGEPVYVVPAPTSEAQCFA